MNRKWKDLVEELKACSKEEYPLAKGREYNHEAKVSVWYVISRIEEVLLEEEDRLCEVLMKNIELKKQLENIQAACSEVKNMEQENAKLREQLAKLRAKMPRED